MDRVFPQRQRNDIKEELFESDTGVDWRTPGSAITPVIFLIHTVDAIYDVRPADYSNIFVKNL